MIKLQNIKKIIVFCLISIFLIGCSSNIKRTSNERHFNSEKQTQQKEKKKKLSEICDWNNAKILSSEYIPNFGETRILQNQNYVFYPESGRKIIRINKSNGKKKIIYKTYANKKKYEYISYSLADNGIYIEDNGNIYFCNFEGENKQKIISRKELEPQLMDISPNEANSVDAIHFYDNYLYLLNSGYIYKLDLSTKQITKISEKMTGTGGCFCNNSLYYSLEQESAIYKIDLNSGKNKRVIGNGKKLSEHHDDRLAYTGLTEVDSKVYYVKYHGNENPIIYMYRDGRKDKKIYEFDMTISSEIDIISDSGKIAIQYVDDVIIYDIKSHVVNKMKDIKNYDGLLYLAGDMLFYSDATWKCNDNTKTFCFGFDDYALCLNY